MRKVFPEGFFTIDDDIHNEYLLSLIKYWVNAKEYLPIEKYRAGILDMHQKLREKYNLPQKVISLVNIKNTDEDGTVTNTPTILIFDLDISNMVYEMGVDKDTNTYYILIEGDETENTSTNNVVELVGEFISTPTRDHDTYGNSYYNVAIRVKRLSETYDTIPCIIPSNLIDPNESYASKRVRIHGQFREYYRFIGNKSKMILYVFVESLEVVDDADEFEFKNDIKLTGYICKQPNYRKTPMDREVTDIMLAVNRKGFGKTDYIPSICWSRVARFASGLPVGTKITGYGRIQSREYVKTLEDGTKDKEIRIAYEVSFNRLEVE